MYNAIYVPSNYVFRRPKTQVRWFVILSFALLGGIAGYGGANLASSNQPIATPTITPTIQSPTETPEPFFTNPAPSETLTYTPAPIPTNTIIPTSTNLSPAASNSNKSESFQNPTFRHISLNNGELLVGTAVRFAIRAYGCNTMDLKENIPYTVFLIRGPLEVDVEIYNGGWDYWADIYDESFAKSLLEPKISEVKQHPNYPIVGHVECIIPLFK